MPNFTFRKVEAIKAKEQVTQLVIDNEGQLDLFEKETEDQYKRQFARILAVLEQAANGVMLPKEKFRLYHAPKRIKLKAYECKVQDLRLYVAQMKNGKVIVLGGMKNRQKADFRRLESLLEQLDAVNETSDL